MNQESAAELWETAADRGYKVFIPCDLNGSKLGHPMQHHVEGFQRGPACSTTIEQLDPAG